MSRYQLMGELNPVFITHRMLVQRYSLQESGVETLVLEAFDINEVANDVYEHNFGHRPSQVRVFSAFLISRG